MIDYRRLDSTRAAGVLPEITELYAAMYAEAPYFVTADTLPFFDQQWTDDLQRDGFGVLLAYKDSAIVGLLYGYRFNPGEWWPGSTTPPPHLRNSASRVVKEWGVRPGHRGKGIGRYLMETWLAEGTEPWATLNAHPEAPARQLYARNGWTQEGTSKQEGFTPRDVLILDLKRS